MRLLAAAFFATPLGALAQGACPEGGVPPLDPCIVGHWVGDNDRMEVLEAYLQRFAGSGIDRSMFPSLPSVTAISVYPDGFYITVPISEHMGFQDTDRRGEWAAMEFDITVGTELGYMWGTETLGFCTVSPAQVGLNVEVYNSDGEEGQTYITPTPDGTLIEMSSACRGDSWLYTAHLPAPLGDVHYYMRKVAESDLPAEYREVLETREPLFFDELAE